MTEASGAPPRLPGAGGRVRRIAERVTRPALVALAVAAFVLTVAMLMTRSPADGAIDLGAAGVGQVAKVDVRAPQALYVPDERTTRRLREEAERAAPIVYVHDPSVRERRVAALRRAFALMREGFDRYDREVVEAGAKPPSQPAIEQPPPSGRAVRDLHRESDILERTRSKRTVAPIPVDGPETPAGRTLPAAVHRPILARLSRHIEARKPEFLRLVPVSPHDFGALTRMRFHRAAEDLAAHLLSAALDHLVVRDKVKFLLDLSNAAQMRTRGSEASSPIEKVVNPADVLDVHGSRARITDMAAEQLGGLPPALRDALASVARQLVTENLVFDQQATAQARARARESVPAQFRHYPRGSTILRKGDVITAEHVRILRAMMPATTGTGSTRSFFGNALFVSLIGALAYLASRLRVVRRRLAPRDYGFLGLVLLVSLLVVRASIEVSGVLHEHWTEIPFSAFLLAIPVSFGAMFVRLFFATELSLLFSFVAALLLGLLAGGNLYFGAYVCVGGFAAALLAKRAKQRSHLLRLGLWVGLMQLGAVLCLTLASGQGGFPTQETSVLAPPSQGLFPVTFLLELAAAVVSGLLSGALVTAVLPAIEATFRYTTDLKYLELANLENPLLKELFLRAPGTYHHSVVAGTLAEAAAQAIGANSSLARVGAYYHDIAKGRCPQYFAENMRGENPHDKLAPSLSALILKNHVKEGVEILREHKMPQPIVDICQQHLGTTLIEFFFDKATRQARAEGLPPPDPADFRYGGPKPQFRESALVFLADSIEAAARAVDDPTEPKLNDMVKRIIRNKFIDGQLDECDLTLRDLNAIARAMTRVLVAIHHTRPKYPSQLQAEAAAPATEAPIDLAEERRRLR